MHSREISTKKYQVAIVYGIDKTSETIQSLFYSVFFFISLL